MAINYHPWVNATRDFEKDPVYPDDIVAYARTWVGARWKHQGRGTGPLRNIDCAGLMQRIMQNFGMAYQDVFGYGREPTPEFIHHVEKLTLRGDPKNIHGALAIFSDGVMPCHVGILATDKNETTLIHAEAFPKMRTHECLLKAGNPSMHSKMVGIRYFPGVKYVH